MVQKLTPEQFLTEAEEGVIIDVRTPAEFKEGHIGGAVNLPLFTNEERAVVGTTYKHQGREQAVIKGLEFVGPRMASLAKKARKIAAGRTIYLYCWRGGMRSGSVGWLLTTAGMPVKILMGGYKAYRQLFRDELAANRWKFLVLGGMTGCGKTEILAQLALKGEQVLDLEGLANHRGSAFGGLGLPPQPTNEQMTNMVFDTLRRFDSARYVWVEGESYSIGKVSILRDLYDRLVASPFIYFDRSVEERSQRIVNEYGCFPKEELIGSFEKIAKRLGYDRVKLATEEIEKGNLEGAIRIALAYYDKGYSQAIQERRRIVASYDASGKEDDIAASELIELAKEIIE